MAAAQIVLNWPIDPCTFLRLTLPPRFSIELSTNIPGPNDEVPEGPLKLLVMLIEGATLSRSLTIRMPACVALVSEPVPVKNTFPPGTLGIVMLPTMR